MKRISKLIYVLIIGNALLLFSCGEDKQKQADAALYADLLKQKAKVDSVALYESDKNNPVHFKNFWSKLNGTWVFQQIQPCEILSKDKYGLDKTNGGTGVCEKMKIIINGNKYKVYYLDFGTKNNVILKDKELNDGNLGWPPTEGEFNLIHPDWPGFSAQLRGTKYRNEMFAVQGGIDQLFWDDKKEALYWIYRNGANCQFEGYCERLNK